MSDTLKMHVVVLDIVPDKCDDDMFFDNADSIEELEESDCYQFPRKLWEKLGSPEKLTVTVTPGDRLQFDG